MHVESVIPTAHFSLIIAAVFSVMIAGCLQDKKGDSSGQGGQDDGLHRFVVIDPGHFHAALVFKRAGYDGISNDVGVYAPTVEDFTDHMNRVIPFNNRETDPAKWNYHIYLGDDFREAVFEERFGDIAIFSGKNDIKIDNIMACIDSGFNVLADKPWVIEPEKFGMLDTILTKAEEKGLVAYDIMTERFEITSILQRLLVNHEPVFGTITSGSPEDPAVVKSSVHHLSKVVSGRQLKRPWWFFDTAVQGEGLVDITTHLVDLVFWILYPDQAIDYTTDIEMVSAKHWPTQLSLSQYETITANPEFPPQFKLDSDGTYPYFCNGQATFAVNGVHTQVEVVWNYEAPKGTGDTHYSIIKGSKANVLVLQGQEQNFSPKLYVEAVSGADHTAVGEALSSYLSSLTDYPGITTAEDGKRWRIDIPDTYSVGHEAHFGQVADAFLGYLGGEKMAAWEKPNMLAKYYVTTKALEMCRK